MSHLVSMVIIREIKGLQWRRRRGWGSPALVQINQKFSVYKRFTPYKSLILTFSHIKINQSHMEPENENIRQLVRNIGAIEPHKYLTKPQEKKALGFIEECLDNPQHPEQFQTMIGIDCEMIETDIGPQLVKAMIVDTTGEIIYFSWFNVREGTIVKDYLTEITGIDQEKLKKYAPTTRWYKEEDKMKIQEVIEGKILVGHDLANDLRVLKIRHQAFIDTVALVPHPFGLPNKNKLQYLALQYLKRYIQWGNHDPFEDALAALNVAEVHIQDGRGTIESEPFLPKKYDSPYEILKDAELDIAKVEFFVLRGSQALGITINAEDYKSDMDYIVAYNTPCTLDGRLIKLPGIDISFFDIRSFQKHLQQSDISYLESFFLPKEFVYINKIRFPNISLFDLRGSLGFHLNKSRLKTKRLRPEIQAKPGYKWKIFKAAHLRLRFMDNFIQIKQKMQQKIFNKMKKKVQLRGEEPEQNQFWIDVKRMNPVWEEIKEEFLRTDDFEAIVKKMDQMEQKKMTEVRKIYGSVRRMRNRAQNQERKIEKHERNLDPKEKTKRQNSRMAALNPLDSLKQESDSYRRRMDRQQARQNRRTLYNYPKQNQSSYQIKNNPVHGTLETIKLLRTEGILALEDYKVSCKRHCRHNNLIQMHYLQSASFKSQIPRQCRGLIVDQNRNYEIVALPYYKFFDYNDPKYSQEKSFDWESARVYEKKDGSLAFLYYYAGQWNVASSTVPDGENKYCFARKETTIEFRKEFWNIFKALGYKEPGPEDRHKTFVFELMSRNHIIVVKREKNQLCLHGVRDLRTLAEEDHLPYGQKYGWEVTKPLDIPRENINLEYLVKTVEKLDPLSYEGYVVCDRNWTRLKIKSSGYVRINWLGQLNLGFNKDPKRYILIEIVLSGEAEVFCKYCPEWEHIISDYLSKIARLNKDVLEVYEPIKHLGRKKFALEVDKYEKNIQNLLFALKKEEGKYMGKLQYVLNPKKFYQFISKYDGIKKRDPEEKALSKEEDQPEKQEQQQEQQEQNLQRDGRGYRRQINNRRGGRNRRGYDYFGPRRGDRDRRKQQQSEEKNQKQQDPK